MIAYPNDYGMMRMDNERRARMMRQKEDYDADRKYVRMQIGRLLGWLGRSLVRLGERIEVQPEGKRLLQN